MRMRYSALSLCTLLAFSVGARSEPRGAAATSGYEKLRAIKAEAPATKDSKATQFLGADDKGHLFLMRGDSLEVFRLGADGRFDRRVGKLACSGGSSDPVYAAAMDPGGSTWAVGSAFEMALCDFGKEQRPTGLDWVISSVTFSRSGPLVAVAAMGPTPDAAEARYKMTVPRVFALEDDRWQPTVWGPIPEVKEGAPTNVMTAIKAQTDSLICAGPKDAVWLASWNRYRLQEVSASKKAGRAIDVGSGDVEWQKPETTGHVVPRGVVRALVCGREIYLVVSTADGLALDRFEPAQNVLERVLLDGVTVSSSGPMTAALAGNELWLGGRFAADGLWRISLDDLTAAHWKPVKDVRIDGKPPS